MSVGNVRGNISKLLNKSKNQRDFSRACQKLLLKIEGFPLKTLLNRRDFAKYAVAMIHSQ